MKFKIPARLRITQRIAYEVVYSDEISGDDEVLGECDYDAKIIKIATKQSATDKVKTFIHESLHAIFWEFKIPIPHWAIYKLENIILRILVLNKWL